MQNASPHVQPLPRVPGEQHVGDLMQTLRKRAPWILAFAAVAACVAGGVSLILPKQYRATTLLLVSASKVPTTGTGGTERPDSQVFTATYATLLRSRSVAADVLRDLGIGGMAPEVLSERLQVRPLTGTLLLNVSLDDADPALAVRLLDAQTARVLALNQEISSADLSDTRTYLGQQVADAASSLADREARLESARATLQVEALRRQLDSALDQRARLVQIVDERRQEAARYGAEAREYRAALDTQSKTLLLSRSFGDDLSSMPDLAARVAGVSREALLGLELKTEVVNPLYEEAEPLLVKAQAEAEGASAAASTVNEQLTSVAKDIARLETQLAERTGLLDAAQREFDLAKAAYEGFSKSYEDARLSVTAQTAELRVVAKATASEQPISPRPTLNALAAGMAALLIGTFVALLGAYLRDDLVPRAEV